MNILPPNATKQERDLVATIDYQVDPAIIKSFKFNPPDNILPYLIKEYALEELLPWLENPRKAIKQGIKWQRIRGTPESLKIALSWAGLQDVLVEEETPGEHFAEFQIGFKHVPADLVTDNVIALARLSAPIRTRLTRIYNEGYDVRRLKLDDSCFGDFLSDYSGVQLKQDDPVLSFGRSNRFEAYAPDVILSGSNNRNHATTTASSDIYRLDHAILGISQPHLLNHQSTFGRIYSAGNDSGVKSIYAEIVASGKFAKAQIVLSDAMLGDVNCCFPSFVVEEFGETFILDSDALSEDYWSFSITPILEKFSDLHDLYALNEHVAKIDKAKTREYILRYNEKACWPVLSVDNDDYVLGGAIAKEHTACASYQGVNTWHGHKHLERRWGDTSPIASSS